MAQHARETKAPAPLATPVWSSMSEVTQILCPVCRKTNLRRARFCQHCGSDVVLNNDAPTDTLRYVITRVIKQGGQGAVYEGIDESGKIYAIKEMLDSKFADDKERAEAIERFNDEAALLQGLSHPRIPHIYSHFTDEARHYLTMDFVHGQDLEDIIEREKRLPEARVLELADQICGVLDYLHGQGLVYRDMKPSNVMIERDGGVKLVDFGIAKLFKPTERGTQIGTPGYAPPEQYQGLATPQSDIYALGATLHHMLTGRDPTEQMPFSFPRADEVPGVTPKPSKRTSDALERALQKVPQDRYATMRELWDALIPARVAPPAQVRVAPATARMPAAAAAQVGSSPALNGGAAAPARPVPPPPPAPVAPVTATPARRAPLPPPAPVAAPTRQTPPPAPVQATAPARQKGRTTPQPRRGFFATLRLMLVILTLLGTLGLGAFVYLERPAWAEPYVAPLLELIPGAAPTAAPPVTARQVSYELELVLVANADGETLRQAFFVAFRERAKNEFGPTTQVLTNGTLGIVGDVVALGEPTNGTQTYRAQVQGYVYTP